MAKEHHRTKSRIRQTGGPQAAGLAAAVMISCRGMSEVTRLLQAAERGEAGAQEQLLEAVYAELHRMAEQRLAAEPPEHTLQPTALVHEAWLQLAGKDGEVHFANRAHFFGAAAQAMRRILVDQARRRRAEKRGGGVEHLDLDTIQVAASTSDAGLLQLDEALEKLAREDPPSAELVRLRFYTGLKLQEAAEALGISERTARRYWQFARAWLFDELRDGSR